MDVASEAERFLPDAAPIWLLVPYISLVGLAVGRTPAVIAWFISATLIFTQGLPGVLLFSLIFPSMLVMLVYCYRVNDKKEYWFPIAAILYLPFLASVFVIEQAPAAFLVSAMGGLAAISGFGLNAFRQRHASSSAEIRSLKLEREQVRSQERLKIAHELHDIIAHDVTVIAMQARRAEIVNNPEKTKEILTGIGDTAQQALQDLRSLVLILKQDASSENSSDSTSNKSDLVGGSAIPLDSGETTTAVSLVHDIDNIVGNLRAAGYAVKLGVSGDVGNVPTSVRQALRRTVRELGTNILKHADTSGNVELSLEISDDEVYLKSSNRISRSKPVTSSLTGIEAMRTRCEVFGGDVHVETHFNNWSILIRIPLERVRTEVL